MHNICTRPHIHRSSPIAMETIINFTQVSLHDEFFSDQRLEGENGHQEREFMGYSFSTPFSRCVDYVSGCFKQLRGLFGETGGQSLEIVHISLFQEYQRPREA